MQEINADMIRKVLNEPDPMMEAFSALIKSVASDAVEILASALALTGHDPSQLPSEFFVQAVLIEAEKVFQPVDRNKWMDIYDSYAQIKRLVAADPSLQAQILQSRAGAQERVQNSPEIRNLREVTGPPVSDLLNGDF